MPEISVVIPTRDRRQLLLRALSSVLAQAEVDLEVIVVDDGSSDGTSEMIRALGDERVRAVRQPMSMGVSRARNTGVDASTAAWIAFLDDDDFWAPHKLKVQMAALRRENAEISFTSAVVVDADQKPQFVVEAPIGGEPLLKRLAINNFVGTPSSVVVSRRAFNAAGGFDPAFSVLADWDLWLRIVEQGAVPAPCADPLIAYTKHAHNMHVESTLEMVAEFSALRLKHAALIERMGVDPGGLEWSRWVASSHRRAGRRLRAAAIYFETGVRYHASRDLVRAAGMLLGERGLSLGARLRPTHATVTPDDFPWLNQRAPQEIDGVLS